MESYNEWFDKELRPLMDKDPEKADYNWTVYHLLRRHPQIFAPTDSCCPMPKFCENYVHHAEKYDADERQWIMNCMKLYMR